MNALIKVIVTIVISLFLCSCDFNFAVVNGNGNVVNDERVIDQPFNAIEVSRGIDVELSMDQNPKVLVVADENLIDIITTEVKNNTLHITAEQNIGNNKSKKVRVGIESLSRLKTSSGAQLWSADTLVADALEVDASSGSEMSITVNVQSLQLSASSGADLKAEGKTVNLTAKSSSGAHVDSGKLQSQITLAEASSGGDVKVFKADKITTDESSGGHVSIEQNTIGAGR
ncbi:head GIN domain-containing protein [Galbibacter sp.]|jgi:hypothetical protein|uniref:head GIN domain-containing protein n=1 Tax=Galbibacter sp. TaxID=2918471 RepID=UPI003A954353